MFELAAFGKIWAGKYDLEHKTPAFATAYAKVTAVKKATAGKHKLKTPAFATAFAKATAVKKATAGKQNSKL